jgi:hypothetical protein
MPIGQLLASAAAVLVRKTPDRQLSLWSNIILED